MSTAPNVSHIDRKPELQGQEVTIRGCPAEA